MRIGQFGLATGGNACHGGHASPTKQRVGAPAAKTARSDSQLWLRKNEVAGFLLPLPEGRRQGAIFVFYVDIVEGTTVHQLFEQQVKTPVPENYLIRVNRQPVPADQVLQEGDRISFTPTKIEGA
jgi:sulfur carrier protein ThiS